MLIRAYLALAALAFIPFGIWSLTDPIGMTSSLNVDASGPAAVYEMSGIYGGISLAAAALCLAGIFKASLARPALWFMATYMGGYVLARAYHLIVHGMPPQVNLMFGGFELVMFIGAALLLRPRA